MSDNNKNWTATTLLNKLHEEVKDRDNLINKSQILAYLEGRVQVLEGDMKTLYWFLNQTLKMLAENEKSLYGGVVFQRNAEKGIGNQSNN